MVKHRRPVEDLVELKDIIPRRSILEVSPRNPSGTGYRWRLLVPLLTLLLAHDKPGPANGRGLGLPRPRPMPETVLGLNRALELLQADDPTDDPTAHRAVAKSVGVKVDFMLFCPQAVALLLRWGDVG